MRVVDLSTLLVESLDGTGVRPYGAASRSSVRRRQRSVRATSLNV